MKAKPIFGFSILFTAAVAAMGAEPALSGNAGINFAVKNITIKSARPVVISVRSDSVTTESGNEASIDLWVNGANVLNHSSKMQYDEKDYILNGPGNFRVLLRCTSFRAVQSGCSITVKDSEGPVVID